MHCGGLESGFLEMVTGNTFGFCAFTGYGSFWIALCIMLLFKRFDVCYTPIEMQLSTNIAQTGAVLLAPILSWRLHTDYVFVDS